MVKLEIGQVIKTKLSTSGYAKIVGDSTHCPGNPFTRENWDYLIRDAETETGPFVRVTKEELEESLLE